MLVQTSSSDTNSPHSAAAMPCCTGRLEAGFFVENPESCFCQCIGAGALRVGNLGQPGFLFWCELELHSY